MFRFPDTLSVYAHPTDAGNRYRVAYNTETGPGGHIDVDLAEPTGNRALAELMALRALIVDHHVLGPHRPGKDLRLTVSEPAIHDLAMMRREHPDLQPYATFLRTRLSGALWFCEVSPLTPGPITKPDLLVQGPMPVLEETSIGPMELTHHAVKRYRDRHNADSEAAAYRQLRRQVMRHPLVLIQRPPVVDALAAERYGKSGECYRIRDGVFLVCVASGDGRHRVAVTCFTRTG